jgi:serine/threonine protein kinase/cytochrome c-type biogenesis protein CcmH/NrfG
MVAQVRIADRYEIKEPLGEGGMGIVYRALDIKTKSYVALKTMRDVASDPVAVELFAREWGVLAGLSHPNIVDIRDVGEIDDRGQKKPFFVMPLLPGVTLAKLIETSSARLTVERVVNIICQVCRGLQAAHEHGLIHRDIKPSNIFVMEDDTAKIIDFGVVHLANVNSITGHKGTWQYMSPEQVEMKPGSPVSDVFSLGVVCYETLTGRKPFARKTPGETADAIRSEFPPPVSDINPTVSRLVSMAVHKAMAKQPIHRFSSARDFGDTLQRALHNQPIERFDRAKIQPRIERAKKTFADGDYAFATEILTELEAEGHIDSEIAMLRAQIDHATRQKKIRQLLEGARARLEQDEVPLALEKVHEILEIDRENTDALAMRSSIEKQRNERQIENWMTLARTHVERHDFAEARQALNEVLKLKPSDASALDLLSETGRREQEALRVRSEKEELYGLAMHAYQNGEISTALSKLERILEFGRETSDASVPDRDAHYQSFYNQVRTERDALHNSYEEGRRHLAEKNYARSLEICDELLAKYPGDAMFHALKLETVEQQRQDLSAYIAEVGRRADAEPDLDRKVNILKEACERYPAEQQFQQSLKLTRERRDLVLSIVARARQYEEKNQFAEAIGQWDILRNIYPKYPGIDYEVDQLVRRRDQQAREDAKSRRVEQVDRALESGDFARARELALSALAEYPQDQELAGLERLARQGVERCEEARKLQAEAETLAADNHLEEAVETLRRAAELDARNAAIRGALVNALVEQARGLMETDWRKAEPLIQQASDMDATHPGARTVRSLIADCKRKELVSQCLAETRELQAAGNSEAALSRVEAGLAHYPNEARLAQLQATLQNSVREARKRVERSEDVEAPRRLSQQAGRQSATDLDSILEQSQVILRRHPDDPEICSVAAEIHERVGRPARASDNESSVFSPTEFAPGEQAAQAPPKVDPAPEPRKPEPRKSEPRKPEAGPASPDPSGRKIAPFQIAIVGAMLLLIVAAIGFSLFRKPAKVAAPAVLPGAGKMTVQINASPSDAIVTVNNEPRSGSIQLDSKGVYDVSVSRPGYVAVHEAALHPAAQWNFKLEPEPVRLRLSTAEKSGEVFRDDQKIEDLQDGQVPETQLPTDSAPHTISVKSRAGEVLAFTYQFVPGGRPRVSDIKTKDLVIISSLGSDATLYSGARDLRAGMAGQEQKLIPAEGLNFSGVTAANRDLTFSNKDLSATIEVGSAAPVLSVRLNAAPANILTVHLPMEDAHVYLDNREVRANKKGFWWIERAPGKYKLKVTANGFEDYEEEVEFTKGVTISKKPELKAKIAFATLLVQGGTPGAEVQLDRKKIATLDSFGAIRFDQLQTGTHSFSFHKDNYEPSGQITRTIAAGQQVMFGSDARLKEFGKLQFQVTPREAPAQVTYNRVDQPDVHPARAGDTVSLPEGRYNVTASADGYTSLSQAFSVTSGKVTSAELKLTLIAKKGPETPPAKPITSVPGMFDEPHLEQVGEWFRLKDSGYSFLKRGISRFVLTFENPKKGAFGRKKKAEWVINYADDKNKVVYELDMDKLTVKSFAGGSKSSEEQVPHKLGSQEANYTITVMVQPSSIVVSTNKGVLHTYEGQDLMRGRIGLKGNTLFTISR